MNILIISLDRGLLGRGELGDVVFRHREYGLRVTSLDIIVFCKAGYSDFEISQNVHAYPTNSRAKVNFAFDARILGRKLFLKKHYDLIVTQDPFLTAWVGLQLKKEFNAKILIHIHGDFFKNPGWLKEDWKNRFFLLLGKSNIKRADGIRVMSTGQKEKLLSFGIREDRIRTISTPVNLEKYNIFSREKVNIWREKFHPIVLHVGRRDDVKDYKTLFFTFEKIYKKFPQAHLWQAGAGWSSEDVRNLFQDFSFLQNGHFRFFHQQNSESLKDIYHASEVVVLTSRSESFGKVLVEALACGKPVVSTATTGAKDIIEDGYNGFLAPVGDSDKLAEKICLFLSDPALAHRMGENGRKRVYEKFNGKKNTEKILLFWQEIVSGKKSPSKTIL